MSNSLHLTTPIRLLAFALLFAVLLAAACGDSDSNGGELPPDVTPGPELTIREYILEMRDIDGAMIVLWVRANNAYEERVGGLEGALDVEAGLAAQRDFSQESRDLLEVFIEQTQVVTPPEETAALQASIVEEARALLKSYDDFALTELEQATTYQDVSEIFGDEKVDGPRTRLESACNELEGIAAQNGETILLYCQF